MARTVHSVEDLLGDIVERLGILEHRRNEPATPVMAAAPTTGAHVQGERVWNSAPTAAGYIGWVCVTGGTPGTWKGFGQIQS